MQIVNGTMAQVVRNTEYSVLGDTLARRTFDESGDYTVRPFQFDLREAIDNDYQGVTNIGVYGAGGSRTDERGDFLESPRTDENRNADESLLALQVSPGKAYVKGYEIEKIANSYLLPTHI